MRIVHAIYFALLLLGFAAGQSQKDSQVTQVNQDVLSRHVNQRRFDKATTTDLFRDTLASAHAPGGIVVLASCSPEGVHSFVLDDSSLGAALDAVAVQDPNYRWHAQDGTVIVVPSAGVPELLRTRIAQFQVERAATPDYALDQLLNLREVRQRMEDLGFTTRPPQLGFHKLQSQSSAGADRGRQFSIHRKDLTLLEALNAIAAGDGEAVWLYSECRCGGRKTVAIDFVVR